MLFLPSSVSRTSTGHFSPRIFRLLAVQVGGNIWHFNSQNRKTGGAGGVADIKTFSVTKERMKADVCASSIKVEISTDLLPPLNIFRHSQPGKEQSISTVFTRGRIKVVSFIEDGR